MYKYLFYFSLILSVASFVYFLLGLMNLKPLWAAAPLFFISIVFTLHCYNRRIHQGRKSKDLQQPRNVNTGE